MMVEEGVAYNHQQRACSKSTNIVPETLDKGRLEQGDSASEHSDGASEQSFEIPCNWLKWGDTASELSVKIPCNWPMRIEDPDELKVEDLDKLEDGLKEDEGKEDEWRKRIEGLEKQYEDLEKQYEDLEKQCKDLEKWDTTQSPVLLMAGMCFR